MDVDKSPESEYEVCMEMRSLLRDGSMFDFNPAIRVFLRSHQTAEGEQV